MTERVPSIEEVEAMLSNRAHMTHYEGCEHTHTACATLAVLRSVRQLLEDYRTLCAFDDERIALLDALLHKEGA